MPGSPRRASAGGPALSPDDAAPLAARAVVRFHLRVFARAEGPARAGDVEGVHQLRVATRRLRAALRLFGPMLPEAFVRRTAREVAWLGDVVGAVRDLDVLAELLAARAARLDASLRGALGPLGIAIHDRRTASHAALVAALDSPRCRRLLDGLAAFADSPAPRGRPALGAVAPALVRPLLRAVLRAGRAVEPASPPEALHRLRVRGKRLRYALETLRGLGGPALDEAVRELERLQRRLGEHQDAVVAGAWLRRYAEAGTLPPRALLAAGALLASLERRARRLRRRFPALWARLDRGRLRKRLTVELGRRRPPARLRAAG